MELCANLAKVDNEEEKLSTLDSNTTTTTSQTLSANQCRKKVRQTLVFERKRQAGVAVFNSPSRNLLPYICEDFDFSYTFQSGKRCRTRQAPVDFAEVLENSSGDFNSTDLPDQAYFPASFKENDPSYFDVMSGEHGELWRENFFLDVSPDMAEAETRGGRHTGDYPRLQSAFYRELRKKYPIAFQRLPGEDTDTPGNHTQTTEYGEEEEPGVVGDIEKDCSLGRQSHDQKTAERMFVKEKMQLNSKSTQALLNDQVPLQTYQSPFSQSFMKTQRENEYRIGENARKEIMSPSAVDLRQRIAQNNAQLSMYRKKLEDSMKLRENRFSNGKIPLTLVADIHNSKGSTHIEKIEQLEDAQKTSPDRGDNREVVSLESPPDSAIDMDSASLQSIMSGLTDTGQLNHSMLPAWDDLDPAFGVQEEKPSGQDLHQPETSEDLLLTDILETAYKESTNCRRKKSSVKERRDLHRDRKLEQEELSRELARSSESWQAVTDDPVEELLLSLSTDLLISAGRSPQVEEEEDDTEPKGGSQHSPRQPESEELERQIAKKYRRKKAMKARSKGVAFKSRGVANVQNAFEDLAGQSETVAHGQRVSQTTFKDLGTSDDQILTKNKSDTESEIAFQNDRLTLSESACFGTNSKNETGTTLQMERLPSLSFVQDERFDSSSTPDARITDDSESKSHSKIPRSVSFGTDNCYHIEIDSERESASQDQRSLRSNSLEHVLYPGDTKSESETVGQGEGETVMNARNTPVVLNELHVIPEQNDLILSEERDICVQPSHVDGMCSEAVVLSDEKVLVSNTDVSESSPSLYVLPLGNEKLKYSPDSEERHRNLSSESQIENENGYTSTDIRFPEESTEDFTKISALNSLLSDSCNLTDSLSSYGNVSYSDQNCKTDEKQDLCVSPKSRGVPQNNSIVENKLTPYEVSLCVDQIAEKTEEEEDFGHLYSAKQVVIDKSDNEMSGNDNDIGDRIRFNSEKAEPQENTQVLEVSMYSNKGDDFIESHSGGDNSESPTPSAHYKRRFATKSNQRQKQARSKKALNGENGLLKSDNPHWGSNPCLISSSSHIDQMENSRIPHVKSNQQAIKPLSGSKMSLLNSAKAKIQSLRKAKSMDQLHVHYPDTQTEIANKENYHNSALRASHDMPPPPPPPGRLKKSTSFKSLFKFGRKPKESSQRQRSRRSSTPSFLKKLRQFGSSPNLHVGVDEPTHPRAIGRLVQLKSNGTQIVELKRPPHGPFGIYISRATAQYNYGVFITRFSDGHPEKFFAGILSIGDEILEINDHPVHNLSLDEVYDLMGSDDTMVLTTLPYSGRERLSLH